MSVVRKLWAFSSPVSDLSHEPVLDSNSSGFAYCYRLQNKTIQLPSERIRPSDLQFVRDTLSVDLNLVLSESAK